MRWKNVKKKFETLFYLDWGGKGKQGQGAECLGSGIGAEKREGGGVGGQGQEQVQGAEGPEIGEELLEGRGGGGQKQGEEGALWLAFALEEPLS